MIPLHPEAVPEDEASLRWRVVADRMPAEGRLVSAPGDLGDLLAAGALATVVVERDAVVVTLPAGASWQASGPRVRTALHTALEAPLEWVTDSADGWVTHSGGAAPGATTASQVAVAQVEALLAGPAGATIRAHGGEVRVVGVRDGVADLDLAGACAGCPASGLTIATTLSGVLRAELGLTDVRVTEAPRRPFVALTALLRRPTT